MLVIIVIKHNSRKISLLVIAGKILAQFLLLRLNKYIVDNVCLETRCGFRRECGTTDMIFTARQIQKKCREQQPNLYMAFIDLTKAFDTINRDMLWRIMEKFGCPRKYIAIVASGHDYSSELRDHWVGLKARHDYQTF